MISVTYDEETRDYYVAAAVDGSGKITVSFTIDPNNASTRYPDAVSDINSKMKTASGDNSGLVRLELDSGATVYDALVAIGTKANITIGAQNSSYGVYVYGTRRYQRRGLRGLDVLRGTAQSRWSAQPATS